jgi:CDP-glucose 4,6-dehydratase
MEAVVNPNPSFWRGRRVLITGHTGFKDSWLLLWLESLGAEVFGLALDPPSQPSLVALACDMGGRDGRIDLRARAAVLNVVAAAGPEVVIHMAAQALVRASYRDPVGTYALNVMGWCTCSMRCVVQTACG